MQDEKHLSLGQTGFTPGFVSMNFYYHIEILKIIRNLLKNKNE